MNPVVYRVHDADGRLIYIGATGNLPQRMEAHRSAAWWFSLACRVDAEPHPTMVDAFAAEKAAIRAERPTFNHRFMGSKFNTAARLTENDLAVCREWVRAKPHSGYLHIAMREAI